MNPLLVIRTFEPGLEVPFRVHAIHIFRVIDLFLLQRPDEALGERMLCWLAHVRPADLDSVQHHLLPILLGGILDALIRVLDRRSTLVQCLRQRADGEFVAHIPPEVPAPPGARTGVQNHGEHDAARAEPKLRAIRTPDLIGIDSLQIADEIRIAWQAMRAVSGRPAHPPHALPPQLLQQAAHDFATRQPSRRNCAVTRR
jgi:hypothetical protein